MSARTPPPPELYYQQQQPLQKFDYPPQVHQPSPIEQQQVQQVPVVQYQQHQQQQQQVVPNPAPQQQQFQTPQEQWYAQAPFQEPVEVISTINSYTSAGLYDPWQVKMEAFEDPTMQLPSARYTTAWRYSDVDKDQHDGYAKVYTQPPLLRLHKNIPIIILMTSHETPNTDSITFS
ncbi:hypothetical protein V491_06851 [Pseudogymnoascus sp. VKM F-3775]|nr:hypothetical protein V491_06851 [Pseudogymnoascus sp. VKM F-3775]